MNSPDRSISDARSSTRPEGQTIYVVGGTTGEYSDRSEWTVCAFTTEAGARAYVEFLSQKRQQLSSADRLDYESREAICEVMRAFDPCYNEDYTGTRWFVSACELLSAPPARLGADGEAGSTGMNKEDHSSSRDLSPAANVKLEGGDRG